MTAPWYTVAFGGHYSALYGHRDADEAARCVTMLAGLVEFADADVLDLGCGAGRHLGALAHRGARVTGLDYSAELLAQAARVEGPISNLLRGDWFDLGLKTASFDIVLSLFTAFGYGNHPADQRRMLVEISRVLRPGGTWVLDYLNPRLVRSELFVQPEPKLRRIGDATVSEQRHWNRELDRVEKTVTLTPDPPADGGPATPLIYTESVALLDLDALDDLADEVGLRRTASRGDYHGARFDPDSSPRWLFVYQKGVPG